MALIDFDVSEYTWTCYRCDIAISFTTDPIDIARHMAIGCPLAEDAPDELEALVAYRNLSKASRINRALAAHVIKHPEHMHAEFRIPSSVNIAKWPVVPEWGDA